MIFGDADVKTKNYNAVKKFTSLLAVAAFSVASVGAQSHTADSVLLSKEQQGNKIIEKYILPDAEHYTAEFSMLFPINVSNLQQSFADNGDNIAALHRFMEQLADTTMHIKSIKVVGYSSPDGLESKNKTLALARAKAVADYLISNCPKIAVQTAFEAYDWKACDAQVQNSQLSEKSEILAILNSAAHTDMQKQAELEKFTEQWKYFKNTILPSMRVANIHIDYTVDKIVEKVTIVTPPQPKQEPKPQPQPKTQPEAQPAKQEVKPYPVGVVETLETGIIVEVPQKEHHKKRKNR